MNGNVFSSEGIAPTVTTNKGEGNKIAIVGKTHGFQSGRVYGAGGVSPTLSARDYKEPTKVMLYAWTKPSSEQNEGSQTQSPQEKTEESPSIIKKEQP